MANSSDDDAELSDESMEDDKEEAINQAEIAKLDEKIANAPYNYQAHVDRIALLRTCGEFEKLGNARRSMAKVFPLTQTLWLSWLEDEQKFAESEEEHEQIEEIFETAVKDYLCPEVWLEYAQYSIRYVKEKDGIEKIRSIMERALSAVGLHVIQGSHLWEAYREIENAILMTLQPAPGSICTPEQNDQINHLVERIGTLFSRQLAVPLMNMESTMTEYIDWYKSSQDGEIPTSVQRSYEKALKILEEMKPLEEALESADDDTKKLEAYQACIAFEKKSNDPARIQCIYERAIADNCLNSELWVQYLTYLVRTLKSSAIVVSVHDRSVRNCPWTSELWRMYLHALERHGAPHEKLESVLEEALAAGFSSPGDYSFLWQTWCDQARRCYCGDDKNKDELARLLRNAFDRATSHLLNTVYTAFGETGDPDYSLWCYWARCEAQYLDNMLKARQIMDQVMQDNAEARRNWKIWLEYFQLERLHGDIEHARSVLRHAAQSSAADDGSAESACLYLIQFERENGTLDELDDAMKKVESRLSKVQKRKEKVAMQIEEKKKRWEQNGQFQKKWNKQDWNVKSEKSPNKRKINKNAADHPVPEKKARMETRKEDSFKAPSSLPIRFVKPASKTEEDLPKTKVKPPFGPPPGFKPSTEEEPFAPPTAQASTSSEPKHDDRLERTPETEARTVFVSNIGYEVESVEDKLRKIFSPCGTVSAIRLVRSNKGNFRGFAYVEFQDELVVQKALELDRQLLEGRPLFVSPNVDKTKQPDFKVFKYETGMERHKLFVSGLSFKTSEEKVREVFSAHGLLKTVRIVTARNGKSKGLAYIEYENESDASQALIKTDQLEVDGFQIKVAISNPPARKRPSEDKRRVLGGGDRTQAAGRGRGRTQLSMVPRALQKSGSKKDDVGAGIGREDACDKDLPGEKKTQMSNKDFSSLFSRN
ncbi:unnamed protein product [Clavelina lepadiformis]|uniref:RRM domain-containing protein n=1 Tax=Clavelina lepadiformis TaxID=159417 RepID=A0ABP0GJ56_CLALP